MIENIYHSYNNLKEVGVAFLIANKVNFSTKNTTREEYFVMLKKIAISNMHTPNNRGPK